MHRLVKWTIFALCLLVLPVEAAPKGNAVSSWPSTQSVAFGSETPAGFGGSPMGYQNQAALGVSRWLKVTAQTDKSGTAVTLFEITNASRNMLVPCTSPCVSASTYGTFCTVCMSAGNGPYTVTAAEYSDAGRTVATGRQSVITVNAFSNQATGREMTTTANGCQWPAAGQQVNCASGTNADSFNGSGGYAQTSQINRLLQTGSPVNPGDTVELRDGSFNPACQDFRFDIRNGGYTGVGDIVVTSENTDTSSDATGPNLQHGFKLCNLTANAGAGGVPDELLPIMWKALYYYCDAATCTRQAGPTSGALTYGMDYSLDRFETGCDVTAFTTASINTNGQATFDHNRFEGCANPGASTTGPGGALVAATCQPLTTCATFTPSHPGITATNNIFKNMYGDLIDLWSGPNTITDNFATGFYPGISDHPDTAANEGNAAGVTAAFGTVARNGATRSVGKTGFPDSQGWPFATPEGGGSTNVFTGAVVENNIGFLTLARCDTLSNFTNPDVHANTFLMQLQTTYASALPCDVSANGGTGGSWDRNLINAVPDWSANLVATPPIPAQGGTPTSTKNTIVAASQASPVTVYKDGTTATALANYQGGEFKIVSYHDLITQALPIRNGTAKQTDNTYAGDLFPVYDNGKRCYNDRSVPDFTAATCPGVEAP